MIPVELSRGFEWRDGRERKGEALLDYSEVVVSCEKES